MNSRFIHVVITMKIVFIPITANFNAPFNLGTHGTSLLSSELILECIIYNLITTGTAEELITQGYSFHLHLCCFDQSLYQTLHTITLISTHLNQMTIKVQAVEPLLHNIHWIRNMSKGLEQGNVRILYLRWRKCLCSK